MNETRTRWLLAALSAVMVALPFLVVTYPPAVDLPEHVAQVRLFSEALHHPDGPYRIQWYTPYTAITMLFGLIWQLVGPLATGRVGLLSLGLLWTAAAHWIAARRRRSPAAAVMASALFFGMPTYWGFCSFLIGWPVFLVWLEVTTRPVETFRLRDALTLLGLAVLLWVCHALWFATAMGWLLVSFMTERPPARIIRARLLSLVPLLILAVLWWMTLPPQVGGSAHNLRWSDPPWVRLSFNWLVGSTFYGPKGPLASIALLALLLWCLLALIQHGRRLFSVIDRPLFVVALLMFAGLFFLPDKVTFTLYLPERYAAPAFITLVLALPAPRLPAAVKQTLAVGLLSAFCITTATIWRLNEQRWMTGFTDAVAALPSNSRLLGLDYLHQRGEFLAPVFMHLATYGQAAKENITLSASFAELPSPPVVLKQPHHPWTLLLEWSAERLKPTDLAYFDYALVGADEQTYDRVVSHLPLVPVTSTGRWRLYKIVAQ